MQQLQDSGESLWNTSKQSKRKLVAQNDKAKLSASGKRAKQRAARSERRQIFIECILSLATIAYLHFMRSNLLAFFRAFDKSSRHFHRLNEMNGSGKL